jgi:pimeloyl-ACP methyl ester carboxylesterase
MTGSPMTGSPMPGSPMPGSPMTGSAAPDTSPAPREFAAPWGARGHVTQLDGPVHWIEFGSGGDPSQGPGQQGPPIVFVHGLGGSHLNWCLVGSPLAAGRRAVALDLHGFGLTPGTRGTSTVQANTRLLDRFVRQVTGTPVILVGNSMGGLISVLQTASAPDTVAGLVLIDPALPIPPQRPDRQVAGRFLLYVLPGLGELYVRRELARRPPALAVHQLIQLCFADPSQADPAMLKASVALAAERQAGSTGDASAHARSLLAASRSLMRVLSRRGPYWQMMAGIKVPVLLIGGDADRLVPVASMRQASARNPHWESVILSGVGHTPQLEVPDLVVGTIRDWLDRHFTPQPG